MNSVKKLLPFIRPHRKRLGISVFFGVLVAVVWGGNLSAVFPIVTMLIEGESLHDYVAKEIEVASAEVEHRKRSLAKIDQKITAVEQAGRAGDDAELVELLKGRVRCEDRMNSASRSLFTMKWLELHVMPWVPRDVFQAFAWLLGLLLFATALKGAFIFVQDVLVGGIVQMIVMELRKRCLRRVLTLDYQTLGAEGTGTLMSKFTFDIEQVSSGLTLIGARLIREPLKCLTCMTLALAINWRLTLLSLAFLPLLGYVLHSYGKMLKRASRRMMESMSRIYKILEETFEGLKVVIAFDSAHRHRQQFQTEYKNYFNKAMKVVQIDAVAKPTLELLGLGAMFVAMLPGAYLVMSGKTHIGTMRLSSNMMSSGELAVLYAMLVGMLDPCRKMSATFSRIKRSAAAVERLFELMEMQPHVREARDPRPLPRHSETIEFRNVTFQYPTRQLDKQRGPALDGVSLKVQAGEVVAIVGQNGCGKSTLVSLLPRLYDADQGDVLIDGVSVRDARLRDLRRQIGLVTQDTVLFDDTIFGNILYGKPDAARKDVEEAARRAYVTPIIERVPQGFDTHIGEKGRELSGGQRQRIALARAILRDPAILILDEATSAADAESEALIHHALQDFVKSRTVFIITHSMTPTLLDLVTRIVVMDAGRIVAGGTHESLLDACPFYQRLHQSPALQRAA